MNAKGLIILLVIVTSLTGIVLYWNNLQIDREIPVFTITHHQKAQSLGATIYAKASNPVSGKVPNANPVSSVTNPFDSYKNPFAQ
jgi:hypothetical protein